MEDLFVYIVIGVPLVACIMSPVITLLAGLMLTAFFHPFAGFFVICIGCMQFWAYVKFKEFDIF